MSRFMHFSWGKIGFKRFALCKRYDILQLCLVSLYISIRVLHGIIFYRVPPIQGMLNVWDGGFEMGIGLIWLFFTNPNAKVSKKSILSFR